MTTEEYISENWLAMTDKTISDNLNLPLLKVISIRHKMGLKKAMNQRLHARHSLDINAMCYEMWINGSNCIQIADKLNLDDSTVGIFIKKFLPYFGPNKETITLQSKM